MKFLRSALIAALPLFLTAAAVAAGPTPDTPKAILPGQFAGWQIQGEPQTSHDPSAADPTNAGILKEYGFTDFAGGTYSRDDDRTLKLRAARFADASGAFGAYTFYLQPNMAKEQIGDQGASLGQRVLFYRGQILVDALFSGESPMSGAELRELAGMLPRPTGNAGNLPPLLSFMPLHGYIANTQKYALGPQALGAVRAPIAADLVDFSVAPEVTFGKSSSSGGEATRRRIYYPTPPSAASAS